MTAIANAEGKAATELERMAVQAELGDEFTEKKFREMKQFQPEAVAEAVAKQTPAVEEPAPVKAAVVEEAATEVATEVAE